MFEKDYKQDAIGILNNFKDIKSSVIIEQEDFKSYMKAINELLDILSEKVHIIDTIENELKEKISFCEQEANHSLHNEVCHISLKFYNRLLRIIKGEE